MEEERKILQQILQEKDIFNKARLIEYLIKEKGWRLKDIAEILKIKPSYLCHIIRLNRLPTLVIDGFYNKQISLSHLFILSRLKNEKEIVKLYEEVLRENLTVNQTEERLREIIYQIKSNGNYLPKSKVEEIERQIKKIYPQAKIKFIQTRIKGKIIFELKDNLKKTSQFIKDILNKLTY